jgi:hypothetical protein
MNIQRIGAAGSILLCLMMAAGCSTSDTVSPPPTPSQAGASPTPGTGDIVMTLNSDGALREDYATIKELAGSKNLVAIVRGTVAATRDVYRSQSAYRILTVNVTETLRGQVGQRITVLEDGGVVPYSMVLPDLVAKFGATPTPQPKAGGLVDFRSMGARHSEAGDEVVLFLGKNPNSGTPIDTEYFILSGSHGRFTLEPKTGQFVRALGAASKDMPPGFVKSADLNTLKSEISVAAPR